MGKGRVRIPVRFAHCSSLPTDTSYLPIYVQMFFIRVAKAAFQYAHVDTKENFDEPGFCKDMKMLLYNTSRNAKKREANAKAAEPATATPSSPGPNTKKQSPMKRAEVVLERYTGTKKTPPPFKDDKKSKSGDRGGAPEEAENVEDMNAEAAKSAAAATPPSENDDSDATFVETPKRAPVVLQRYTGTKRIRTLSPAPTVKEEKTKPALKKSKGIGKGQGSALEQLENLVDTNAGRDVVVAALHGIIKDTAPGRRRTIRKALEEATELLLKLSNGSEESDWQGEISKYKDSLGKL